MLSKLKTLCQKKNKQPSNEICKNCVWWGSEEENNVKFKKNKRYCDIHKKYTKENTACSDFVEERFEATEESTSTEEVIIDHDLGVRKED